MQWYVIVSLAFCAANFVISLALLGLSCYHLYDEDRYAPVQQIEDWFELVIGLIPMCIFIKIVSLFSCWGVIQKNRKWTASVVALNAVCVFGVIYFLVLSSQEARADPISVEELFNHTKSSIEKNLARQDPDESLEPWVPPWLDRIQAENDCCGIESFIDWENFWPEKSMRIPTSCCITPSNDTILCPTDKSRIPYPGTPAKYLKVDMGCLDEVNLQISAHILETNKFLWTLMCFAVLGELSYIFLYCARYLWSWAGCCQDQSQKINTLPGSGGDDIGVTKFIVSQTGSSTEAMQGDIRIDPDTGNPVVSFSVLTFESNAPVSESASFNNSSSPVAKPLPMFPSRRDQQQPMNDMVIGGSRTNMDPNNTFTYNKRGKKDVGGSPPPQVKSGMRRQPANTVFMVQDNTAYTDGSIDDTIGSGIASTTDSYDDFGDVPAADIRNKKKMTDRGIFGMIRKKRY